MRFRGPKLFLRRLVESTVFIDLTLMCRCDLMKGADHEECQRAYLKTEDCYQRVLCAEVPSVSTAWLFFSRLICRIIRLGKRLSAA